MKKFIAFICLSFPLVVFSQYTTQEIKKFKISRIIKTTVNGDASETQKQEIFYDNKGNDTATYLDGQRYKYSIYEYNAKGQTIKRITYDHDGSENETAAYSYKPDGSYVISNTNKQFGMTDFTYYDKLERIIKTIQPDRSERIYTYDAKGRLVSVKSKPGANNGIATNIQYTYNPKGQLIKEESKGEYKWTETYTYNAKGLIAKTKRISIMDGVAEPATTSTYEYEFNK